MKITVFKHIIQFIIQGGCLALLGIGLWCIFGNSIKNIFREEYHYKKLEKTVGVKKKEIQSKLLRHIIKLLSAVFSRNVNKISAYVFLLSSLTIFVFSFLILHKQFQIKFSFITASILALLPYSILRLRLRSIRVGNSYDADQLITSMANEYKLHYFNMISAIENCAVRGEIGTYSQSNLFRLALALKAYHSEDELDKALEQFVYSYDTEWSAMLSLNIKMAIHRGLNVSSGLEDILKKLKDIREQIEVSNRYNTESAMIIKILLIPLYLGTVYLAINAFGFTLKKFLEYQFINPVGLRMGIITFLCMSLSFMALTLITKPKYDF